MILFSHAIVRIEVEHFFSEYLFIAGANGTILIQAHGFQRIGLVLEYDHAKLSLRHTNLQQ